MLKISQAGKADQHLTLKLEGRIVGPWVGELRLICESLLTNQHRPTLDLSDVTYADDAGVMLLTKLVSQGVMLVNILPFLNEQLKSPATVKAETLS